MAKSKEYNDYGTGIPRHEIELLAHALIPDLLAFFGSDAGKREYAEWEAQEEKRKKPGKGKQA